MTTTDAGYRIAEVARRSGFTTATLRYYEEAGLMPPAKRAPSGYRVYDDRAIDRLRFIARAKQLGCSLDEITDLVEAWDTDRCGPVKHRLRTLVAAKSGGAFARIADLESFAEDLRMTVDALDGLPIEGPCDDTCGCVTGPPSASPTTAPPTAETEGRADSAAIACTLGAGEIPTRLGEWRSVLSHASARIPIAGGVRVEFGSDAPLAELARLANAEHECCRFFRFAITVDARGVGFEVTAPDGAEELVATLVGADA